MLRKPRAAIALVVASIVLFLAALLPWATLGPFSESGLDLGDGWITMVCAVLAGVGGAANFGEWRRGRSGVIALLGAASVITGIYNWNQITGSGLVDVGSGIWLTILAGLVVAAIGVDGAIPDRKRP